MENDRVLLKGVKVYPFKSIDELLAVAEKEKKVLIAINAEKIVCATQLTQDVIERNIGYCDGAGAVKALKKKGYKEAIRIPGCELWLKIIERLYPEGKSFYLVGGKQNIIEATVDKLRQEFPGINIVHYRNGYLRTKEERDALIKDVAMRKPDVCFVAMGSPKQEMLMEDMRKLHPAIYQGLGGSFDVYTGNVKRAPIWWREHNLEWAYRFVVQPTRLKRLKNYMKFLFQLEIGKI